MNERGESDAVRLLWRYRTLCEALGVARAHGVALAPAAMEEIKRAERELSALLQQGAAPPVPPRPASPPVRRADDSPLGARLPLRVSLVDDEEEPRPAAAIAAPSPRSVENGAPRFVAGADPGEARHPVDEPVEQPPARKPAASPAPASVATVFTDGSAEGNPGPGGYCAIVRMAGRPERELSGGTAYTTNNKMELTAAIVGLREAIAAGATGIDVVTDSEYLVKGATQWLSGWERKGWKTAAGQPVKNRDLWEKIAELTHGRRVRWEWVKGHAGHPENERADLIATTRAREAATKSQ